MKIRRLRINFGLFKLTIGEAKIRSWVEALLLSGIEWDRLARYLVSLGIPSEYAEQAAKAAQDWLLKEAHIAEVD